MEYHEPAAQWEIFGMLDFESYCKKLVVKGLFHPSVPKDITDAYKNAEYIMAHAYYHYQLYDEALAKLLRIMEMAVKVRCRQVGIPLFTKTINKKTKEEVITDKKFKTLIDELSEVIPIKEIVKQLHGFREFRNIKMHQSSNSITGGMSYGAIKLSVILINKLFLKQEINEIAFQQHSEITKLMGQFEHGLFVLEKDEKKFLVTGFLIAESIFVTGRWLYALVGFPISDKFSEHVREKKYLPLFFHWVTDLVISNGILKAKLLSNRQNISISPSHHPLDIVRFVDFKRETQKVSADDRLLYDEWANEEINMNRTDFLYQWLWKVGI